MLISSKVGSVRTKPVFTELESWPIQRTDATLLVRSILYNDEHSQSSTVARYRADRLSVPGPWMMKKGAKVPVKSWTRGPLR